MVGKDNEGLMAAAAPAIGQIFESFSKVSIYMKAAHIQRPCSYLDTRNANLGLAAIKDIYPFKSLCGTKIRPKRVIPGQCSSDLKNMRYFLIEPLTRSLFLA